MMKLRWTPVFLFFLASCSLGEDNEDCKDAIKNLENEVKELKNLVRHLAPNAVKSDLGAIEDDVARNTEDISELQEDLNLERSRVDLVLETLAPIGTILAWHAVFSLEKSIPAGWQRCDGSLIQVGPFAGQKTPDLNSDGRFLRGGLDRESGEFEDDSLQDHTHADLGHSHVDSGHTHSDNGHVHRFDMDEERQSDFYHRHDPLAISDHNNVVCADGCSITYIMEEAKETPLGYSQLSTDSANIESSTSNLGGVEEGRMADETRVKNMRVVWIMRIY